MIRFGSVCSGIEAASVAWHPLGWRAAWLSEIEQFPSAVLNHHYPDVPNLGDMTALPNLIELGLVEAPDVFCGGTPCQAFSVAGLRKSLDDARGNLSLTFCEIANAIDNKRNIAGLAPAIIFWENVPGVLSTSDNAFGCFLGALAGEDEPIIPAGGRWTNAGCVFGPQRTVAWRVLDAQYFGVAQRRRRVFVVASARGGFNPAEILFEFNGVRRDSAPSREARKEVTECAGTLTANGGGLNRPAGNANELDFCVTVAPTITAANNPSRSPQSSEVTQQVAAVHQAAMQVRRLTPIECERLQGFPDGYTNIPWRNKPESPDGPRYKALGNSWAVPVVAWIGKRIQEAVKC
jgi:DNA (cytosine-5)-methyltransferase 1